MKKEIIISIVISVLLAFIVGIVYYTVYKCVADREDFKSNIEDTTNTSADTGSAEKNNKENKEMFIKINGKVLTVNLENNSSAKALIEKLNQNDITINMEDYANFEKVGSLEFDLPTNDEQITTSYGDIILYQGNKITIYYDTNSWNFTKLGRIDNVTQEELKRLLGKGNVTVTLSLKQ